MKYLNAKQLAFILQIKNEEARKILIYVHCKSTGIQVPSGYDKDEDDYPNAQSIKDISVIHNLPTPQKMVDDITEKYLERPASRGWIAQYPEKLVQARLSKGKPIPRKIAIPSTLKSFLNSESIDKIKEMWQERYKTKEFKGVQLG